MKRKIQKTDDGSHTLFVESLNETYHSTHGAIQEARHVFIENGLKTITSDPIRVFEMGFGTGLNALLTLQYAIENDRYVEYTGIEAYPVDLDLVEQLNYTEEIDEDLWIAFDQLHATEWRQEHKMFDHFIFQKINKKIEDHCLMPGHYDLIYFDAFGPRAQEEMWAVEILQKMNYGLKRGGKLVTYCAQGQFKRNLQSIGFEVVSLPGPPGKREMTVGVKL